jgi:hypothetical protein
MKKISLFTVILILIICASVLAFGIFFFTSRIRQQPSQALQKASTESPTDQPQVTASRELQKLFQEDQNDSRPYSNPLQKRETDERARQRINQVAEIVQKGLLQSAEDYYHAAMVYQHGNHPEDYLTAHVLATAAAFKGYRRGAWLSAASLDAFLLSVGRPQVLGTIYGKDNFRRYEKYLSDAIRKQYCIPPLDIQIKNEALVENGSRQFQRWAKECEE